MKYYLWLTTLCLLATSESFSQEDYPLFKGTAKGYASYRQFQTFENTTTTATYWRKQADLPALELKGEYYLTPRSEVEIEIEIEHGGTGTASEYEPLEEFGEFETEVEKGGEVVLSEFYYQYTWPDMLAVKAGKIPVFISLGNVQQSYLGYPTVLASSAEQSMLPQEWRDLGVEVHRYVWDAFAVRASVTNGLNSEFFRKYSWVGGGKQRQFETVNADGLAGNLTLEYGDISTSDGVALSFYQGDTAPNRYKKKKLGESATLTLLSLFGSWHFFEDFGVRAQVIRGTLENSEKVTLANSTLPANVSPGAFSPLGHKAELEMIEISYRFFSSSESPLTAYVSYEHVNSMAEVEGAVLKDDRYNQTFSNFGLMWNWHKAMFLKSQYTKRSNALAGIPATDDYQLALGFDLQGFNL